jgi:SAM-dependent methyltransferase
MKVINCCLCGSEHLQKVVEVGSSAPANNLEISEEDSLSSQKYPLDLLICSECNHVQLGEEVDPNLMFSNYSYETGISQFFRKHFKEYASELKGDGVVVDIGSNDCILLDALKEQGMVTVGIEPAKNLVEKYKNNHDLYNSFLTDSVVNKILEKYGEVDYVTANNVFAHNRNLRGFVKNVKSLLKDGGLFYVEVQYLSDLIQNGYFDMIYHEHTSYHHIKPIRKMMDSMGMNLVDAKKVSTHGGSIRLVFQKNGIEKFENELILEDNFFDKNIEQSLESLNQSIRKFKINFERTITELSDYDYIYGYAAPAKVVTLLSVLDKKSIDSIDFIIDDSKLKQNKFLPGYGIEIVGTDESKKRLTGKSSVCIIFAWNVAEDIKKKIISSNLNPDLIIVPLPNLEIINEF